MALLKQVDFAKSCKILKSSLATYIIRGKVVKDESGMINDKLAVNRDFRAEMLEKKKAPVKQKVAKPGTKSSKSDPKRAKSGTKSRKSAKKAVKTVSKATKTVARAAKSAPSNDYWELQKQQKRLDIEETEADLRLKLMKEEKTRGELLPRELVLSLIIMHFESMKHALMDGGERLIVEISQIKQLSNVEKANLKKAYTIILNSSIDRAVDATKKGVSSIVKEYSQTRARGERG